MSLTGKKKKKSTVRFLANKQVYMITKGKKKIFGTLSKFTSFMSWKFNMNIHQNNDDILTVLWEYYCSIRDSS